MIYNTIEELQENFYEDTKCQHKHGFTRYQMICSDGRIQMREICCICGHSSPTLKRQKGDDARGKLNREAVEEIRTGWLERNGKEYHRLYQNLKEEKTAERRTAYHEYLQTDKWQAKRKAILERDKHLCQGCLHARATVVHHLTYDNVKDELAFQLISLCRTCHARIHDLEK